MSDGAFEKSFDGFDSDDSVLDTHYMPEEDDDSDSLSSESCLDCSNKNKKRKSLSKIQGIKKKFITKYTTYFIIIEIIYLLANIIYINYYIMW